MLLEGQNAVVYGGAGAVGTAVALAFAREGAEVHLVGRTMSRLQTVVDRIHSLGGIAEATVIDAADEVDVDEHVDLVAALSGSVDLSFNVTAFDRVHPETGFRSQMLTTCAAARHMMCQRSGVILLPGWITGLEVLRRSLITDIGARGVRVVQVQSAGIAEIARAAVSAAATGLSGRAV